MPPPTPRQQLRRARLERAIGLAAPLLDLVLSTGERLSKVVGREDDYIPIRAPSEAFELAPSRKAAGPVAKADGTSS